MSGTIKTIPKSKSGLLDTNAMYTVSIKKFEEVPWNHSDAQAAYRGEVQVENIVEGTGTWDEWMGNVTLPVSFYIPTEDVSWYKFAAKNFDDFRDAVGLEDDKFDPEEVVGKSFNCYLKDIPPGWYMDKKSGVKKYQKASQEIRDYFPQSIED